ncbi:acetylornithine deacetylase [Marinobacter fuscus]|uniref:Acetylornithine deacetylase n=1 Tax=Marinobacter fuscus TaxID=2109942 RepID=A0A2T1K616_9GAMM|nr:acetylornithine deacetylase [Marinobacter fuscus]PSF05203.1 acetylornithine deacetylase [Marinobacter fuscus]
MKRLLSFLVITGLVAFAAYKASAWWLLDQRLAGARAGLSEYGVLNRGSIGSSLDGRIFLEQPNWQDFRLTQPVAFRLLEFDAGSPVTLLTTLLEPGRLPATWNLAAEGVSLELEPTMFRNWVTAGPDETTRGPLVGLACAPDPRQQLGSGDLMRMGIAGIRGDFTLHQSPETLRLELNTRETGSLELVWPDARLRVNNPLSLSGISSRPVQLTLRDAGLMRRLSAYCARETGQDVSSWAGKAVAVLDRGLRERGWQASPQLLALYRQWLTEGGELSGSFRPASPTLGIPVHSSAGNAPGADLLYNGARVPDVYLTEIQPEAPEPLPRALTPVAPPEDPGVEQWYAQSLETANDWLNRRVRVTLSNDNQVEGRLASVGERDLEIARTVAGGEVAYPILKRAITHFEVWRRGRPE